MKALLRSRLFKSTFWTASGNGVRAVVSFVTAIFVVRNLGPSEYGQLQEMTAIFAIVQNLESLVNPNIYKRLLLENPEQAQSLIISFGAVVSLIGVICTLVMFFIYKACGLAPKYSLLVVMLIGIIFRFSNAIIFYLDAKLETFKSQFALSLGNITGSLYKFFASIINPTSLLQSFAVPIQYLSTLILTLVYYRRLFPRIDKIKFNFAPLATIAISTFPLFLANLVDLLKGRFPFLYLGSAVSSVDLGLFSAGVKLTEPWLFIGSALTISFWPKLVATRTESKEKYAETIHVFFAANIAVFGALAIGGYFFSHFFIDILLGGKYAGSLEIFKIQSLALIFQAMSAAFTIIETNEGIVKISFGRNVASLATCVVLVYLLVPRLGITGASYAILLSNAVPNFIFPLFFRESRWMVKNFLESAWLGPKAFLAHMARH